MTATSAVDSTTTKTATATCAAGQRVLGGGGVVTFVAGGGTPASLALFQSEPTVDGSGNPNGWIAGGNETQALPGYVVGDGCGALCDRVVTRCRLPPFG